MPRRAAKSRKSSAVSGKRYPLNMRTTFEARQELERAAAASGRSLAQEVEHRLNRSFVEDGKIAEMFGDRRTFVLMQMMAQAVHFGHTPSNPTWLDDPIEFEKAISAALRILEAVQPEGSWPADAPTERHVQVSGQRIAMNIWRAIKRADLRLPLDGTDEDHRKLRVMKDDLRGLADRALENDKPPTTKD
jgi:hypothetical protein